MQREDYRTPRPRGGSDVSWTKAATSTPGVAYAQALRAVPDFLHGDLEAALGQRRELVSDAEVLDGNRQPPSLGGVAKDIPGQRQHGSWACRVRHDLRTVCGRQFAQLHLPRCVHRSIYKD